MAITIPSSFNLDASPDTAWRWLTDIERAAPCFPGVQLKEKQPDGSYKAAFTVKLGPLTFNFAGKFNITEQNDAERIVLITATGTDTKGRGGVDANIRVGVVEDADAKSKVAVVCEANLFGSVAQFGRGIGMIEALSRQLLNQFSKNLSARIAADQPSIRLDVENATPPAAPFPIVPLDAWALMRNVLWHSIRRFFARFHGTGNRQ